MTCLAAALLAYADNTDTSGDAILLVVISIAIIAVTAILAGAPVFLSRLRRKGASSQGLVAALTLWAILVAGASIYYVNAAMRWNRDYNQRIMSGYFDPQDQSDKPSKPWAIWGVGAGLYLGLVVWSVGLPAPGDTKESDKTQRREDSRGEGNIG